MKLQGKTTIILFGAIAIMLCFNLIFFRTVIAHNFAVVEADTVRRDVAQVVDTINSEIFSLENQASDYAYWDETYDYIEDREPAYIEDNFRADQFAQYLKSIDYILLYGINGELILSRGYDHQANAETPVPDGLLSELTKDDRFIRHPEDKEKCSGLILAETGSFLLASFPVTDSTMKGAARGTLIFAASLDETRVRAWGKKLHTSLSVFRSDELATDPGAQSAQSALKVSEDVYIDSASENRIVGYVLLKDIRNTKSLLLRVDKRRAIYEQGVRTIYYLALAVLMTGLVVGLLILHLLGKTVLTPLAALLSVLQDIERSADIKRRLPVGSRDELGELGEGINRTLDSLQRANANIRTSENRLRAITESASDAILVIDHSGIITFWNPAAERVFGFSGSEILGQRVHALFGSEHAWRAHLRQIADRLSCGDDCSGLAMSELVGVRKNGAQFPCELSLSTYSPYEGSQAVAIIRDVTLRKRAEEHVAESNARFNRLARESRSLIWEIDTNGLCVYVSDVSDLVTGYLPDEVIGKLHFYDFHPEEERRQFKARAFDRFAHRESFNNHEHRIVTRDKKTLWLSTNGMPFYDSDGNLEGYRGLSIDITVRKGAEEARSTLELQLQQAHKMESVGRLAGGVAHDFNNMLSVILGYAEVGLAQASEGTRVYVSLTEIHKAAMRSADLTRRLLTFARKQTVVPKVLDLNAVVGNMLGMLKRLIGEDIRLNWESRDGLWQVKIDPTHIDQILANLCVNARDAIPDVGAISIELENVTLAEEINTVHMESVAPGDYVRLLVRDNGCGMDAVTLSHLFEPFYTTKKEAEGTGLGLATVYGAVKQNNGFMEVQSALKQGSTFTICLPRSVEGSEPQVTDHFDNTQICGHETILLVEDEEGILRMITEVLELRGYTVLAVENPFEAIRVAREKESEISLLITDVIMPEMNGRELAKTLDTIIPDLRTLFMSGYTDDVIAKHGVLDAETHFIHKPFTAKNLIAKVRQVLRQKVRQVSRLR